MHARKGNADAVNRLLERHRQAVHRLIRLRLDPKIQRRVDVSDIVQDVFVDVNRRLSDYLALSNPPMPFHLWLRHIAQDRIIDAHRRHRASAKRSVDRERALAAPAANDRSTQEFAASLRDNQITPATAAERRELSQQVSQAIASMDEADAEIIVMRNFEQLSNQEVAAALELSEPAASMRYLRAIRRLKEMLHSSHDGSEKG